MKKQNLDRIIIKTNSRMTEIINWYLTNKDWLKEEEFHSPLNSGLIVMEEECLDIGFEVRSDGLVDMAVYPAHIEIPAMTWIYNPSSTKMTGHKFPGVKLRERETKLKMLLRLDNTDAKESIKFHALMLFIAHYEEVIEVDKNRALCKKQQGTKNLRTRSKQPASLVKKTYILRDFSPTELHKSDAKRKYTKPNYEVQVRGYYRQYKSGKKVWVKPFSRYKDNGEKQRKTYKV